MSWGRLACLAACSCAASLVLGIAVPRPNGRQLEFMELETIQFMHFGVDTFWTPPPAYLRSANPTYHNCNPKVTGLSHDNQTDGFWPCLHPLLFNPAQLDADSWMRASVAFGMKEICLTAKHEGGFALWPSNFTDYSVAASSYKQGKGDVLREFVDAARRWGVKICYYINPVDDGYLAFVANVSAQEYKRRQMGMLREVLGSYGPVNRLWFDGVGRNRPADSSVSDLYDAAFATVRAVSPGTLISPYRGDVCSTTGSLYTNAGPPPNSTSSAACGKASEDGQFFHPNELHGITIQEGPDGNSDNVPTYWFWHDWACAGNITGCPWIGHANASRLFDSYLQTVGHGAVLNINAPPTSTGLMNGSVVETMTAAGKAINDTFFHHNRGMVTAVTGGCGPGVLVLNVSDPGPIDYIVTMEDLTEGQRIANYSVEFRRTGSDTWETLVPPVVPKRSVEDRPDGHDPRDSYIGHKRIDFPIVSRDTDIGQVRFNCLRAIRPGPGGNEGTTVKIRQFSLHEKRVPW